MLVSHLICRVLASSHLECLICSENCYSNHVPELPNLVSVRGFFILQAETNSWQFARKVKKGDHKFAIWCGNSTSYLAKSDLSTKKPQPICFGQASLRILIAKRHVICTHIGTKSSYVHIHILRNMNVWRSFPLNIHTFTTGQVKDMNH